MRKPVLLLVILLSCVMMASFLLGTVSHCAPAAVRDAAAIGEPYCFVDPSVRWGEITDFAVCENTLYVLFSGKEVLDCYALDGTYSHSYYIELGDKGTAALYVNNGTLYLKSKGFMFYTFCDGYFAEVFEVPATALHSQINKLSGSKRETQDFQYELRGASIWRHGSEADSEIVRRPGWMVIFQGSYLLITGPAALIALCLIVSNKSRRRNRRDAV